MEENINTDQWKCGQLGDCRLCRRRTYCNTPCKNYKIFMRNYISKVYQEELQKVMFNESNTITQ